MAHTTDYEVASIDAIQTDLGHRIEALRLSRNIQQLQLAAEAGVSRRTITRLESGQSVSLDTLLRVMRALGLTGRLATLLPNPTVLPVDRVRLKGKERKRASAPTQPTSRAWRWADGDVEA